MRLLLTTAQISKIFLRALPPNPLNYPSCLQSIDPETTTHYFVPRPPYLSFLFTFNRLMRLLTTAQISKIFLWALPPDPLIYPSCLHSIDYEITTCYSENVKNFHGGFAPRPLIYSSCLHSIDSRPPFLSFLFTFNRL